MLTENDSITCVILSGFDAVTVTLTTAVSWFGVPLITPFWNVRPLGSVPASDQFVM